MKRLKHVHRLFVNDDRFRQPLIRCLWLVISVTLSSWNVAWADAESTLRIAAFQADVTPPLGSPLCNGGVKPAMEIVTPLTARGIVLLGADQPIVLCAFDWVGIANESHDRFREALWLKRSEQQPNEWHCTLCINTMRPAAILPPSGCWLNAVWNDVIPTPTSMRM